MADLTPEHTSRRTEGDLHPEVREAYRYVDSVVTTADFERPLAWCGWALREAFLAGCTHARAALADQPAVSEGRYTRLPSDEELRDLWSWAAGQDQGSWPTQQHCFARAVLARWGNPASVPAEELIQSYQAGRRDAEADAQQAAEAAAQDEPVREVAELVAWLRRIGPCNDEESANLLRAAELLQRQATAYAICERERLHQSTRAADLEVESQAVPVAVSERLPGPEDCDAEGRCWAWRGFDPDNDDDGEFWQLIHAEWLSAQLGGGWTHWLPVHALPLPEASE